MVTHRPKDSWQDGHPPTIEIDNAITQTYKAPVYIKANKQHKDFSKTLKLLRKNDATKVKELACLIRENKVTIMPNTSMSQQFKPLDSDLILHLFKNNLQLESKIRYKDTNDPRINPWQSKPP